MRVYNTAAPHLPTAAITDAYRLLGLNDCARRRETPFVPIKATRDRLQKRHLGAMGSKESGYTRFMRLYAMTQGNESVNAYYTRFRRVLRMQKLRMKDARDNHIYHHMFIAGLNPKINAEIFRFPQWLNTERMKFHEILGLATRAEYIVKTQTHRAKRYVNGCGQFKGTKRKSNSKPDGKLKTNREAYREGKRITHEQR